MSNEKVRCTKCDSWKTQFVKSWEIKSPVNDSVVKVSLYGCEACRKRFRVYGE